MDPEGSGRNVQDRGGARGGRCWKIFTQRNVNLEALPIDPGFGFGVSGATRGPFLGGPWSGGKRGAKGTQAALHRRRGLWLRGRP